MALLPAANHSVCWLELVRRNVVSDDDGVLGQPGLPAVISEDDRRAGQPDY